MPNSFRGLYLAACGLIAMGTQGSAHSYEDCMALHVASCLDVNGGQDPLGNCQAQANAYCASHSHGGGSGVQPIEPIFTIEDRDQSILVITEYKLDNLDDDQIRLLKNLLASGVEAQQSRQKQVMARFRMLVASESEVDHGDH